ncbi:hypothetical protein [Arenimonas daejeonensis]|uniref:hypothetical protein n=1 Tax=Arenimonas daejeonensis TaxID=370777 RepID=UPI002AD59977|nr:hypothetical protein [Arenimonas daejeonensis]
MAGTTERQVVTDPSTAPPTVLVEAVTPPLALDSYHSLDLYASLANANWTFRAYMKNATDERAYSFIGSNSSALTGATVSLGASPILPRTMGFEVDYRF